MVMVAEESGYSKSNMTDMHVNDVWCELAYINHTTSRSALRKAEKRTTCRHCQLSQLHDLIDAMVVSYQG